MQLITKLDVSTLLRTLHHGADRRWTLSDRGLTESETALQIVLSVILASFPGSLSKIASSHVVCSAKCKKNTVWSLNMLPILKVLANDLFRCVSSCCHFFKSQGLQQSTQSTMSFSPPVLGHSVLANSLICLVLAISKPPFLFGAVLAFYCFKC